MFAFQPPSSAPSRPYSSNVFRPKQYTFADQPTITNKPTQLRTQASTHHSRVNYSSPENKFLALNAKYSRILTADTNKHRVKGLNHLIDVASTCYEEAQGHKSKRHPRQKKQTPSNNQNFRFDHQSFYTHQSTAPACLKLSSKYWNKRSSNPHATASLQRRYQQLASDKLKSCEDKEFQSKKQDVERKLYAQYHKRLKLRNVKSLTKLIDEASRSNQQKIEVELNKIENFMTDFLSTL